MLKLPTALLRSALVPLSLAVVLLSFMPALTAQQSAGPRGEHALHEQQLLQDKTVRINQIQVIGTHNSYHAGFAPSEAAFLQKQSPKAFDALDYTHPPLADQLSAGIRQLEIDVYADQKGGRFAHPAIDQHPGRASAARPAVRSEP